MYVNTVINGETVAQLKRLDLPTWDVEKVIRRRKQLSVQGHLRIAEQYIPNVAQGIQHAQVFLPVNDFHILRNDA